MPDSQYPVLFIISLAIGSLVGAVLDIDSRFQKLVARFSKSNLGEGLGTGILLYCIGTLSIVGGILIASSGLNILKIKDVKTMNMLPALLVPMVFFIIKSFF